MQVSTEVDAHLSFDTQATVDKALSIVDLYNKHNTDLKRIYIKASPLLLVHNHLSFVIPRAL